MNKSYINYYINRWNDSGRIAFHYPRKKMIRLNGGVALTEKDAIKKIKECLKKVETYVE